MKAAIAALAVLLLAGCDTAGSSPGTDVNGSEFIFLSSNDTITIGSNEFVLKSSTGAPQFGGTVKKMANLFSKLIVTYTYVPEKTAAGTVLFVLPVEGMIMPVLSGISAVPDATYATFMQLNKPMAAGGACAAATTDYTGRMRPGPTLTRDLLSYGLGRIKVESDASLTFQSNMVPMTGDFSAASGYVDVLSGFTPSAGIATNSGGASMFFTPSGAVLVRSGNTPEDEAYFLLPSAATAPSAGEITANGIEYRGWVEFPVPDPSVGKLAQPITFRGDGTNLTGGPYTQFGQNLSDNDRVLTLGKSVAAPPGVFDISLLTREGFLSQNRRIIAVKINGRIILLGAGDRDGNNNGDFNDPGDWITSFMVQMTP